MRYTKRFAGLALAAGTLFTGASTLSAQDWRDYRYSQERHIDRDYDRIARMRADIGRDQARLNEDIRCGRSAAAARDAADLARDQRALNAQIRDVRRDQYGADRDRGYWR